MRIWESRVLTRLVAAREAGEVAAAAAAAALLDGGTAPAVANSAQPPNNVVRLVTEAAVVGFQCEVSREEYALLFVRDSIVRVQRAHGEILAEIDASATGKSKGGVAVIFSLSP